MAVKVQVILDERERDLFQRQAALDGMSLRRAAHALPITAPRLQ